MKRVFIVVIFCALLPACSKKKSTISDKELPVIVIATPTGNQVFQPGDAVTVSGSAIDNDKLAEVHVHVYNNLTGTELLDVHHQIATSSYAFLEIFPAKAGIQYKIQIMAIDVSANTAYATVYASVN